MSGKGELVKYTRLFEQGPNDGPLTPAQKDNLKTKVNALIDSATVAITIDALIVPSDKDLRDELKKRGG